MIDDEKHGQKRKVIMTEDGQVYKIKKTRHADTITPNSTI